MRKRVLFVCIHNSARSQMAEAFLNQICPTDFEARSAGLEPGPINPLVVEVMREVGIDLSHKKSQAVWDVVKRGELFGFVVSVCDEAAERCPIFPGVCHRRAWSFADPSAFGGTHEEKLARTREVRDEIRRTVEDFAASKDARPTNRRLDHDGTGASRQRASAGRRATGRRSAQTSPAAWRESPKYIRCSPLLRR